MRFALVLVLALIGCDKRTSHGSETTATVVPSASMGPAPAASASSPESVVNGHVLAAVDVVRGASIYDLRSPYVDQSGQPTHIDRHRGHPTLIAMFYGSCPSACPKLIGNVRKIEAALSPSARDDLRVLLVTIDPENDTPEALRGVVSRYSLDTARWSLLTGKEDDIRDAAAVLGIQYRQASGSINHSSVITLLDREGRVDARFDGITDAHEDAAKRIAAL